METLKIKYKKGGCIDKYFYRFIIRDIMQKFKFIFYLSFIMCFFYSGISYSYINIYPTKFRKDISHSVNETFYLYNRTNKPVKYRVYIEKNTSPHFKDMSDLIEIYPKSVILNPLQTKEIRLAITPPSLIEEGVYKAKLIVKEVEFPNSIKKKIDFMTIFKLNLTGYVGDKNVQKTF